MGPEIQSDGIYQMITERLRVSSFDEGEFNKWRRAAVELADSRANEFLRTCLAIIVYLLQIVSALVTAVGGEPSSPPGGRIGAALFISWLLPGALLSNTIGGFTSRRTCLDTMRRFVYETTEHWDGKNGDQNGVPAANNTYNIVRHATFIPMSDWDDSTSNLYPLRDENGMFLFG